MQKLLTAFTLQEAAMFQIEFVARSTDQVEEWFEAQCHNADTPMVGHEWEVKYRGANRSPKVYFSAMISGRVPFELPLAWVKNLTVHITMSNGSHTYRFHVVQHKYWAFDGMWTTEIQLESGVSSIPARFKC